MDTVKEKWEEIIQKLKVEYFLSNISFETWIRPLEVYDIVGDTLYLSINFKASIEHIQNKYLLPLKVCIAEVTGVEYDIKFIPKDGMKVLVRGRVTVYEATGGYQIYVEEMTEDGIGNLYIAFEQLKEKLAKEGLFNKEHKKKIVRCPKKVGIVTASTGAAIRDILTTIKRRYPICETILFPCLVQGDNAKYDIVKKIELANTYDIDTLIVGSGG